MGQALERMVEREGVRSRALDAVCALGVAATGADLVIVTRLGVDGHAVAGWHGALVEGSSVLSGGCLTLEELLHGAAAVEALTLHVDGAAAGLVMLARREGGVGAQDRAVLFRLRQVVEAQIATEGVLVAMAEAAFHRIEAARA